MTKQNFYSKLKTYVVLILVTLLSVCVCGFFFACGSEQSSTDSETTYSYTEKDTDIISNSDFAYGTYNKAESSFPVTSPTGWSRATDNSSATSGVNSGVISTVDTAWDKLFDTLYSDNDFSEYLTYKFKDQATADIRAEKEDEEYTPIASELKAQYKKYFANPLAFGEDPFVYMLNNYVKNNFNFNSTAQRIRSSSTVSVKKGEIYKISVYVKTLNVTGNGANVRLVNTVNGSTQSEYRISGIKDTEWSNYTVYFKANDDYDCTFTLMLGLGYGNGDANATDYYSEGTVFFDSVKAEKVDAIDETYLTRTDVVNFMSDDVTEIVIDEINQNHTFAYDMNYVLDGYFTDVDLNGSLTADVTATNVDGSPAESELTDDVLTVATDCANLTLGGNYGVTVTLKNGNENFKVAAGKYLLLNFKILNSLNKLSSTDITIDLFDILGDKTEKRAAIATFSDVSDDFVIANLLVENNFEDTEREFYIQIVVGPTDVANVSAISEYAKGTVTLKDVKTAEGFISSDEYEDGTDNVEYKIFNSFSSNANATVSLYAGYNSDNNGNGGSSATYSLTPAKGTIGKIVNGLSDVAGYYGIVANHIYITGTDEDNNLETLVNQRNQFATDGYAGLINTMYMENYTDKANLKTLLKDLYDEENDIQPIIIYNNYAENVANHYGFVGEPQTVSASSNAKVTLKIKTDNRATAYIYLVDVSKETKEIMTFADFKIGDENYSANDRKFVVKVDKNSPVGDDGWVEVNFYVATGATAKSFRVEVWNGSRDGNDLTLSKGYVAINSISVTTSSAFTEPESVEKAVSTDNPIFNMFVNPNAPAEGEEIIKYTRELTDDEKAFNKEYPDQAVSYAPSYIWATNGTSIYAVFNTVDPVVTDPYDNLPQEEESAGCSTGADPSTFWLSFSSILLAAVIVLALIALIVKNVIRKHNSAKSDVAIQYKVKSRAETHKAIRKAQEKKAEKEAAENDAVAPDQADENAEDAEPVSETEAESETDVADNSAEEDSENPEDKTTIETDYVYGDVQDFGDMTLDVENAPEQSQEDNGEDNKQ